jgi:hypothetical protein
VLRWNTTKTYLAELAAKGAPVVPTHAVDRLTRRRWIRAATCSASTCW